MWFAYPRVPLRFTLGYFLTFPPGTGLNPPWIIPIFRADPSTLLRFGLDDTGWGGSCLPRSQKRDLGHPAVSYSVCVDGMAARNRGVKAAYSARSVVIGSEREARRAGT